MSASKVLGLMVCLAECHTFYVIFITVQMITFHYDFSQVNFSELLLFLVLQSLSHEAVFKTLNTNLSMSEMEVGWSLLWVGS